MSFFSHLPGRNQVLCSRKRVRAQRENSAKYGVFLLACIFIATIISVPSAKIRVQRYGSGSIQIRGSTRRAGTVKDIEDRLRPFLERKLSGVRLPSGVPQGSDGIRESDFLALARAWEQLSPGFRKLYLRATQIPDSFLQYVSPGGNFEIYYTNQGTNAVDTTDRYGYGNGGNWRHKISARNGTPDYIDEVAWALDSSWSMQIDRFNFSRPIPYRDAAHPSSRYKVVISSQQAYFYGMTYVQGKSPNGKGYQSFIEINNDWSGSEWRDLGYDTLPANGARVTCAHEFLHAIQYAMTWNVRNDVYLDSFPITWIEGTAVLMEELAFDSINDYLQYAAGYFDDPGMSFFDELYDGVTEYTNSILTKYLYEFASGSKRIDFVKSIFDNNYARPQAFHPNLRATAASFGKPWVEILNSFHAGSHFVGSRADTAKFLADSRLFKSWDYYPDLLDFSNTVTKSVNPYGMEIFSMKPETSHGDTLVTFFTGQLESPDTVVHRWAVSAILRKEGSSDSLIRLQVDSNGTASLSIRDWKRKNELLLIVSSGYEASYSTASVFYQTCPITYSANHDAVFLSTSRDNTTSAKVNLQAHGELRCALLISESLNDTLIEPLRTYNLKPLLSRFDISYPLTWGDSASVQLEISALRSSLPAGTAIDSMSLYHWNLSLYSWQLDSTIMSETNDSLIWKTTLRKAGVYGLFARKSAKQDTTYISAPVVQIFPNPAKISNQNFMRFEGNDIVEVAIYSSDGSLVTAALQGKYGTFQPYTVGEKSGLKWDLTNNAGKTIAPGSYVAVVGYKDPLTKGMKRVRRNIMVIPVRQ